MFKNCSNVCHAYALQRNTPERTADKTESHLFDLLKRGYIDARHKNDYTITGEELNALIEIVKTLQLVVYTICHYKISSLGN